MSQLTESGCGMTNRGCGSGKLRHSTKLIDTKGQYEVRFKHDKLYFDPNQVSIEVLRKSYPRQCIRRVQ